MDKKKLKSTARSLVSPGKGILAADESTPTIKKRLDLINLESTEENRRSYRGMLFTTPGIEKFLSGVILFDETIRQKADDGTPFPKLLADRGIIPGIKVDKGAKPLALFPGERITEGLDGLRERLEEYRGLGARFTKWRAVITIGRGIPTKTCIDANAQALARFAALSQEAGLVPIVEPEVLMDGSHTLARCEQATGQTLKSLFSELANHKVFLEGVLLKTNMVTSGQDAGKKADVPTVAKATVRLFRKVVPRKVPGVVFLSGGQSPELATQHLNAINQQGKQLWELSYSFGRALQGEALKAWAGKKANLDKAQKIFYQRARRVSAARRGELDKLKEEGQRS